LDEGAERFFFKKNSWGQEEGEGEKSLTHPKLTHRRVPIKKSRTGFFWMLHSWVLGHSSQRLPDNRQRSVRVSNHHELY
jgi:hypothetical protein